MGGLRGGASAQGPGGPADAPGLNVRRDVQGRRRRAAERGVAGRAAERGQRRRWRLTGGAGEGERGVSRVGGNRSGLTGYRSNRSGPVPVWAGIKPAQIQNLNLNLKK